jgi:hypothetical protein
VIYSAYASNTSVIALYFIDTCGCLTPVNGNAAWRVSVAPIGSTRSAIAAQNRALAILSQALGGSLEKGFGALVRFAGQVVAFDRIAENGHQRFSMVIRGLSGRR